MTIWELDGTAVALRALVYLATVFVAGSVLVRATLGMREASSTINRQIAFGAALLFVCEPLRYVAFQLSIAQGDWSMAFDPAMRWMGLETPIGQAAIMRLTGTLIVLAGFIWQPVAAVGALVVVGSYLFEGHTVSSEWRVLLAALLVLHLLAVHWWIGALLPLRATLATANRAIIVEMVERFSRLAIVAVAALASAGALVLAILTNWEIDLSRPYQQGFALKLLAFAAIGSIAGVNKLRWTPRLKSGDPTAGIRGLRAWLTFEIVIAAGILFATAVAVSFPPSPH